MILLTKRAMEIEEGKGFHCTVCDDDDKTCLGLQCESTFSMKSHYICKDCSLVYLKSLLAPQCAIRDGLCPCCLPECKASISDDSLVKFLAHSDDKQHALRHWFQILRALTAAERRRGRGDAEGKGELKHADVTLVAAQMMDALLIRCPQCRICLDPAPDGCRAMHCPACGCHYCFVCFAINTQAYNHQHVRDFHGGNVFID